MAADVPPQGRGRPPEGDRAADRSRETAETGFDAADDSHFDTSTLQLHLPDLPELPIAVGMPWRRGAPRPWPQRLREAGASLLPLGLMAVLALGSWWLVRSTPPPVAAPVAQGPRTEPDYRLDGFTLERFAPDGKARMRVVGRALTHHPADDRLDLESVHLQAWDETTGALTQATARQAVASTGGQQVRLMGGAHVESPGRDGTPVQMDSEFLQLDSQTRQVSTDRPVVLRQGTQQIRAAGLHYDAKAGIVTMQGPLRAEFAPIR